MHPDPKRIAPVILILAIAVGAWWLFFGRVPAQTTDIKASGTIEAVEVVVAPEVAGRVTAVNAAEGDTVTARSPLVTLDDSLLRAQQTQAQAAFDAAANAALAAAANADLLKAGPTAEQLAVAQTGIDRAQIAVDALQQTYDDLSDTAKDTANGKSIQQQLDTAIATVANAQAQYDVVKAGANPKQIEAALAQSKAAESQAAAAKAALAVLDVQLGRLTIAAPADGTVLARAVEPGEVVSPGSSLLVIADLSRLHITVYVPENIYGSIGLGQAATVTVDSYPGETFTAKVQRIANAAEFTPRNVQTASGRKTTVFAITLTLDNPGGKLKPGMPADVVFGK